MLPVRELTHFMALLVIVRELKSRSTLRYVKGHKWGMGQACG
jgi:hypothetical protein